jgi:type VI secretion system protein ImpK
MQVDDPFRPADATVLRPRPGAGKRGWNDATPLIRAAVAPPTYPEAAAPAPEPLGTGMNPLVQAASSLLLLGGQLRGTLSVPDVGALRRHALDEIRRFEERARSAGVAHEVVLAARYALCAALDEAVLSTPWGAQSEWAQQTLLVALHREAWGGEKFFEMLNRISRDPARHLDLMELQYLCVAFGFAGKYQVDERGHARLAEVQQDLYRKIRSGREVPPPELSLRWRGIENRRNPVIRYVPWWVVGAAALALVAVTFAFYYSRLGSAAAPVHAALARIGTEAFTDPTQAAPSGGVRLKELLAREEARGAMTVEEQGGRTLITLAGRNLFASGSATLGSAHDETVRRLADALNQVPGRVLVVGHTDDQPLASLRYRDNFELSRERAVTVVKRLQRHIDNPARIEWTGAGPSEPRYRPETDPEHRSRNRRVEVIHVRGS